MIKINKNVVPDTSVLINKKLFEYIQSGKLKNINLIIPRFVIDELQAQAAVGRDVGFQGLEEIKRLRKLCKERNINLKFSGRRPTLEEISLAKKGRIDALIRDFAIKEKAVLITSDYVQALVGEAEGANILYIPSEVIKRKITIENFFTDDTQSVHLKPGLPPYAKIGKPGSVRYVKIRENPLEESELKAIINEIYAKIHRDPDSFIEINKQGATVIQMGNYRISITRPPFSDAIELTAVRPIVKLSLEDYNLPKDIEKRIVDKSSGILIAGPPGSGKSSFASALAEFLASKNKVVKTFEQPRDLQVGPRITQYAPLEGDWESAAELLLLVRPDYTIFDELRKSKDFKIFADMRLSGVGMIGVVHSNDPVSAIQRFIGRVELGGIPHIIDTVIFIEDGKIKHIYELSLIVKVPSGMQESDLARPVVEIRDFETKKLMYEIYTYGEENVIVPIGEMKESPLKENMKKVIIEELKRYDKNVSVEIPYEDRAFVYVRDDIIPRLIGKGGRNIEKIEKKLGIKISIRPSVEKKEIDFEMSENGKYFKITFDKKYSGKQIEAYKGDELIFAAIIGKKGIRVRKDSEVGEKLRRAILSNDLKIFI